MKNLRLLFAGLLFASAGHAQVSTVLIEACNAVQDSSKRLECLKAAMQQGAAPVAQAAPDATMVAIESVDKAITRMQSNISIGISYNNYQTALLDLAQPVSELKRVGTGLSTKGLALLDKALATYADAGEFWRASIEFYSHGRNELSYFGGLPVGLNNMEWLVNKYGLPTGNADLFGFHRGLPVAATRNALWVLAASDAADGVSALRATEPEKTETPAPPPGT